MKSSGEQLMLVFSNTFKPPVKPWSTIPIVSLLIGLISIILISFLVHYLDKKGKHKILNILIFIYGLVFLSLEIYHEVNRFLELGHYDWSSFPFQFCSIPIYMCPISPFIKNEKIKNACFYYLGTFCLVSGIFPLLFGQGQLCRWPNPGDTIRSFVWHILIVHIAIISIVHKKIGKNLKTNYKPMLGAIGLFISFTIIAQLVNVTLHYAGGINFATTDGAPLKEIHNTRLDDPDIASCFYISPFFVSNMPVYSSIYKAAGWIVNYIAYLLSFSLMSFILYFTYYGIYRLINLIKDRINKDPSSNEIEPALD